jgi:hypothetical protein
MDARPMSDIRPATIRLLLQCVIACAALSTVSASLAAETNSSKKLTIPRTADGKPDFSGFWTHETITPLERPAQYGERLTMNEQELRAAEKFASDHVAKSDAPTDPKLKVQDLPHDCGYGFTGANCGYNNFWVDRGEKILRINGEPRASILTDPPNGRMPPLKPEAMKQQAAARAAFRKNAGPVDGPELRSLGERCILSFGSNGGPPMLPNMYNNAYQFVQTKDNFMVLVEMVHDARVVRFNGKPLPASVPKWLGDSLGRWEGDTMVIETTNFHPLHTYRGAGTNRKVVEKFSYASPNEILYQFTVSDPTTFTKPFGGELIFNKTTEPVYEYACHEGNYALPGILAGARAEESQGQKATAKEVGAEDDGE